MKKKNMYLFEHTTFLNETQNTNDSTFGRMKYDHNWSKSEEYELFGKKYKLKIVAKAFSGKEINDKERNAYSKFKKNQDNVLKSVSSKMIKYINDNLDDIKEEYSKISKINNESELAKVIKPTSIVFGQDGSVVMLFECAWDSDNGLAIQIYPSWKIGAQNLFL